MSTIAIACPYALDSRMGNVVTGERIAGILGELGHTVRLSHGWDKATADLLLALNAVKSAGAVAEFRRAHPEGKVAVLLTGTDLYGDFKNSSGDAVRTLAAADRIVLMTPAGRDRLPAEFSGKVRIVPKSVVVPEVEATRDRTVFGISVVGHLREVKNPFRVIEIVSAHPEWEQARVWQVGAALDEGMRRRAQDWETRDSRYRWLGGRSREEGLAWMKRSAVTVNTSAMEGASNALLEAMTLGVPVFASAVEGNVGLLGEDHGGLFEPDNEGELAALLRRGQEDEEFLESLRWQGTARARAFARGAERAGWQALLAEWGDLAGL